MKQLKILLPLLIVTGACHPKTDEKRSSLNDKDGPAGLVTYEASEWEPSWRLTLSSGTLLEFRQLDHETGADFVTAEYRVKGQTELADGWTVQTTGENGTLTFTTSDVSASGGCTHSGSGYTYRDAVAVSSPLREWRGCGGPKI